MSGYRYYDDLSGDDSSDGGESHSDDEEESHAFDTVESFGVTATKRHSEFEDDDETDRCIVHADVDCFYCQCEMLDRKLDPSRPLAIKQKHIVVTCNYAAREAGISKLCLCDEAMRKCPHLLLVEGSDLERYRIHGRKIYESFRRACHELVPNGQVAKHFMDEMIADLSLPKTSIQTTAGASAVATTAAARDSLVTRAEDIYVYGYSDNGSSHTVLTEDQSGAQTVVHAACGARSTRQDPLVLQRLNETAALALKIRETVLSETGFTITMGISTNVLLAKLASGLKKPGKVNVLPPGRDARLLVEKMPLRKIPGVGRRTMKVLVPCITARHGERDTSSSPWTCGDLLRVPRADVTKCLDNINTGDKTSAEQCSIIIDLCRGQDRSTVIDDQGGVQKTLSVENSFKRGSVTTKEKILEVMEDLYRRLPRLLKNRTEWSTEKAKSYPTSIRLTVRSVDPVRKGDNRRRPFSTTSKQTSFDGKTLLNTADDVEQQASLLRLSVRRLLNSLVFDASNSYGIDVTRINVALTGFQDVAATSPKAAKNPASQSQMQSYAPATARHSKPSNPLPASKMKSNSFENEFDADVLKALPPDIAAEVRNGLHSSKQQKAPVKKRSRIDQFFASKRKDKAID